MIKPLPTLLSLTLTMLLISTSTLVAQLKPGDTVYVTIVEKTEAHPYFGRGYHKGYAMNGVEGDTLILVRDSHYVFNIHATFSEPKIGTTFHFNLNAIGGGHDIYDNKFTEEQMISKGIWTVVPSEDDPDTLYYGSSDEPWMGGTIVLVDSMVSGIKEEAREFIAGESRVYPNPCSEETAIEFLLEEPSRVQLEVLDGLGRIVMREDYGLSSQGRQHLSVNCQSFPSGLYHYRITATTATEQHLMTGKLQVLK